MEDLLAGGDETNEMSAFNEIDITCEECGEDFKGSIWTAINAGEDPELKDLLLGGELNLVLCTSCSKASFQEQFLLYQEPALELVAYVYPPNREADADDLRDFMKSGFSEAQEVYEPKKRLTYGPILMFGLESLVELLNEEEEKSAQSKVAKSFCHSAKLHTYAVKPSKARELNCPWVIPLSTGDKPTRSAVLGGLDKLLKLNPALSLYADLKKTVYDNPNWSLEA